MEKLFDPLEKLSMTDMINHPPHYIQGDAKCGACGSPIECIDVTRHMDFNLGNVIKYIWRAKYKNGMQDILKAQWYLNDAVNELMKQAPK
jgi:hypothetical protein